MNLFFLVLHVMGIRSLLAKPFAAYIASNTRAWSTEPFRYQDNIFKDLVSIKGNQRFSVAIMISHPSKTTTTLRKIYQSGTMRT